MERFETHWVKSAGNRTATLFGLGKVAEADGDLDGARSLHRQAVEVATAAGSIVESARAVEALAGLALLEGDAPAAALLLGAAAGLRGILTKDDPEVSRTAAAARAALGEEPYEPPPGHAAAPGGRAPPGRCARGRHPGVADQRRRRLQDGPASLSGPWNPALPPRRRAPALAVRTRRRHRLPRQAPAPAVSAGERR